MGKPQLVHSLNCRHSPTHILGLSVPVQLLYLGYPPEKVDKIPWPFSEVEHRRVIMTRVCQKGLWLMTPPRAYCQARPCIAGTRQNGAFPSRCWYDSGVVPVFQQVRASPMRGGMMLSACKFPSVKIFTLLHHCSYSILTRFLAFNFTSTYIQSTDLLGLGI